MRKLGLVLFLAAAFVSCESGNKDVAVGFKTTMKINAVYDAGKIAKGEIINAKFTVENTGDSPLILSDVKGSCSCTVADFSQDPIAPGKKGYIKASVNTESFSVGPATRSIRVLSNTTPAETTVIVKATIIR